MPSGGGASGEVILPEYLIFQQANWLNNIKPLNATTYTTDAQWTGSYSPYDFNVRDEMIASADDNPFTGVAAYDPSDALDENDARVDEFEAAVDSVDPSDILVEAIAAALSEIDGELIDESYIASSVDAYEQATNGRFLREVGRALAGFQAGRAVMSTHYDARAADFEIDRGYDVGRYEAELRLNMHGQRMELAKYLSGQFISMIQLQLNALQNAATLRFDASKLRIAAEQDRINIDLNLDVNEGNWRLDRFDYGAKMIAAYSGGGPAPKPLSTGERVMQTLLTATSVGIAGGEALGSARGGLALGGLTALTGLGSLFFGGLK